MCPICGVEFFESVLAGAQISVSHRGQLFPILRGTAYICDLGHLFIVPTGQRGLEDVLIANLITEA